MAAPRRCPAGRTGEAAAVYQKLAAEGARAPALPPWVAAGLAVCMVVAGANEAAEALLARCQAEEAAAADWAARTASPARRPPPAGRAAVARAHAPGAVGRAHVTAVEPGRTVGLPAALLRLHDGHTRHSMRARRGDARRARRARHRCTSAPSTWPWARSTA